jgi:NADPH2:quinone reductase
MGSESVGVVDALGEGVDDVSIGQRVITVGVRETWQEFVVADARRVLAAPEAVSVSTAAQMITNPLTALLLVTNQLEVKPGEWLLQTAAGSTVGKMVLQLGIRLGFKTINVVRRRAGVEEIRALGGNEVICTEDEDLRKRVTEIVGPGGVSKAIDCVAGQIGADVSRSLAPGGKMMSTVRSRRIAKPKPTSSPSRYSPGRSFTRPRSSRGFSSLAGSRPHLKSRSRRPLEKHSNWSPAEYFEFLKENRSR